MRLTAIVAAAVCVAGCGGGATAGEGTTSADRSALGGDCGARLEAVQAELASALEQTAAAEGEGGMRALGGVADLLTVLRQLFDELERRGDADEVSRGRALLVQGMRTVRAGEVACREGRQEACRAALRGAVRTLLAGLSISAELRRASGSSTAEVIELIGRLSSGGREVMVDIEAFEGLTHSTDALRVALDWIDRDPHVALAAVRAPRILRSPWPEPQATALGELLEGACSELEPPVPTPPEPVSQLAAMYRGGSARRGVSTATPPELPLSIGWTAELGRAPRATPAAAGDLIVVRTEQAVAAFDTSDGELRWQFDQGPAVETGQVRLTLPGLGVGSTVAYDSSPTIAGETVYVGGRDGFLRALELGTGRARWSKRMGPQVNASPAVVAGVVIIADDDGMVVALDAGDGEQVWEAGTGGMVIASPVVVGELVYVANNGGELIAIELSTGRWRWATRGRGAIVGTPAMADRWLIAAANDGMVRAFHPLTGWVGWEHSMGQPVFAPPTVAGDLVVVTGADGLVVAFDAVTGERRWQLDTPMAGPGGSTAAGGRIWLTSPGGPGLVSIDLDTGQPGSRWTSPGGGGFLSAPVFAEGHLYLVHTRGELLAIGAEDSTEQP